MLIWWSLSYFLVICHFRTIEKIPPISQSHGPNLTRDHFWPGGDFFLLLWIYFKITKIFMSRNHALNHWIWITVFSPFMPYFVNDERGEGYTILYVVKSIRNKTHFWEKKNWHDWCKYDYQKVWFKNHVNWSVVTESPVLDVAGWWNWEAFPTSRSWRLASKRAVPHSAVKRSLICGRTRIWDNDQIRSFFF